MSAPSKSNSSADEIISKTDYLFSHIPLGCVIGGPDFKLLRWNQQAEKILGYTAAEVIGTNPFDIMIPAAEHDAVSSVLERTRRGEMDARSVNENITKDGRTIVCEWFNTPIFDAKGDFAGFFATFREITQELKAQEEIRAGEHQYHLLFEQMISGVGLHEIILNSERVAVNYRFLKVNQAFERLTGLKVSEITGRLATEVLPGLEPRWLERFGRVALTGEPCEFVDYTAALDRHYSIRCFCPQIGQFAVVFHDVTEQVKATQALAESERFVREILNSTSEGVVVCDPESRIIWWNKFMEDLTGFSADEAVGTPVNGIVPNDDILLGIQVALSGTRWQSGDFRYYFPRVQRSGWFSWTFTQYLNAEGEITGAIGTVREATSYKEYEAQLQSSLDEKEVLLREVHHRVKNNLQMIIGMLQLQANSLKDAPTHKALRDIEARIRTISLVHEALYRKDQISEIAVKELFDQLCRGVLEMNYAESRIDFTLDTPDLNFDVDFAIPCGLIINELMSNAVKYAFPEGRPHTGEGNCRIHLELRENDGEYFIVFSDNGVGLEEALKGEKVSLGLYLIDILCTHQLGGRIEIDSKAGTTARLRIPKPLRQL